MKKIVEIKHLTKNFGKMKVLDDISLDIYEGDKVAILGPSGCGKTTLLRILAGIEKEYQGEVFCEVENFGYIFQEPRLIPWKNVLENLLFVSQDIERISLTLKKLGLDGFEKYNPSKLSGGMKQRVNLARALIVKPQLLLLDEPFASLDVHIKKQVIDDILRIQKEEKFTLLMVTHDINEGIMIADKIIIMSKRPGKILELVDTAKVNVEELLEKLLKYWS